MISLSEYGCNTNKRQFGEIASLYSDQMTGVYSGGLVYEYSEEGSKYGLVELDGNSVKELPDFSALKDALANTTAPKGDGGYNSQGGPSPCPKKSDKWEVDLKDDELPKLPQGADEFFKKGAGKGPGLAGPGSQEAGSSNENIGDAGAGTVTNNNGTQSGQKKKGAAASVRVGGAEMAIVALVGAALLF